MSFKTIVEIISKGNGQNNNSYFQLFDLICDLLKTNGLALIADVTTKTEYSDYMPLFMSQFGIIPKKVNMVLIQKRTSK